MSKLNIKLSSLILGTFMTFMAGISMANSDITESEVTGFFDLWNEKLQTGNPSEIVDLYAEDAVLLPTMSNEPRVNHAGIEDYFVNFMAKQPSGKIDTPYVRILGDNVAVLSGIYTFNFATDNSEAQARFTYVYEKQPDGEWKIVEHHSSAMPES